MEGYELIDIAELRDKNQLTIPKKIIDESSLEEGHKVKVFYNSESESILLKAIKAPAMLGGR